MFTNYNRNSTESIDFLLKFLSFFGIAPQYDFQRKTMRSPYFERIYSCFLVVLVAGINCFILYNKIMYMYQYMVFTQKFFDFTSEIISCISYVILVLHRSFGNMNQWKMLFNQMNQIEAALQTTKRTERNWLKRVNVQLLIALIFIAGYFTLNHYVLRDLYYSPNNMLGSFQLKYYLPVAYYFMSDMLLVLLIVNIALIIKCKYQRIIERLKSQCKNSLISDVKTIENSLVPEIKKISYLCLCVNDTIRIFNKIFGLQILFISLHTIVLLVHMFKLITTYMVHKNNGNNESILFLNIQVITASALFAIANLVKYYSNSQLEFYLTFKYF